MKISGKLDTPIHYFCFLRHSKTQFWSKKYHEILTPQEFYKDKFKKVRLEFVSQEFIEDLKSEDLVERFKKAKTIPGTLGFHSFSPIPGVFDKKSRRNIVV